jgi:hypothetical protein
MPISKQQFEHLSTILSNSKAMTDEAVLEATMSEPAQTIQNMMKVSLKIQTDSASAGDDTGKPFTFIYGIGPSGITPFEKAIFGKGVGDTIQFDLTPENHCATIGHLELPLREQTGIMAPVCMRVTITGVVRAQDREVVKAMAAGGSCSDCGCGCGGH